MDFEYTQLSYDADAGINTNCNDDQNIFGVELEIDYIEDYSDLNDLCDAGIIETHETGSRHSPAIIKYDGSVQHEIVLRAATKNILFETLDDLEVLNNYVSNGNGTSCHIHLNRKYMENTLGLEEQDIMKAAEFVAPLFYAISGRNINSYLEWTPSALEDEIDINSLNLMQRAEIIENNNLYQLQRDVCRNLNQQTRYTLCNIENYNTIEIRVFSNYHDFLSSRTKFYIECMELLQELAVAMKNKSYVTYYKTAETIVKLFFEKHNYYFDIIDPEQVRQKIKQREVERIQDDLDLYFELVINNTSSEYAKATRFIQLLEHYNIPLTKMEYKQNLNYYIFENLAAEILLQKAGADYSYILNE